jgi:hypothetical protein
MTKFLRASSVLFSTAVLIEMITSFAGAAGVVPPRDPAANVAATPAFNFVPGHEYAIGSKLAPCWRWLDNRISPGALSPQCVAAEVQATNHSHRLEHIAGVTLPRNFRALTAIEQLLVLVDLERVSRGEQPVLGLSKAADSMAQLGAQKNEDPSLSNQHAIPGVTGEWRSNWAAAVSPLDANYSWMYLDGWHGKNKTFNFACTSAHAPGCWGHRNNILVNSSLLPCYASRCALVMGAGEVTANWGIYNSYSELIVQIAGTTPPLVYSWKQAVAAGATP